MICLSDKRGEFAGPGPKGGWAARGREAWSARSELARRIGEEEEVHARLGTVLRCSTI
jgi:hypothetical protein